MDDRSLSPRIAPYRTSIGRPLAPAYKKCGRYLNYVPLFFPSADLSRTPAIARYMRRCAARPAFARAFGQSHADLVEEKTSKWLEGGAAPPSPLDAVKKLFG